MVISVIVVADISVRIPRKLFFIITENIIHRIKESPRKVLLKTKPLMFINFYGSGSLTGIHSISILVTLYIIQCIKYTLYDIIHII